MRRMLFILFALMLAAPARAAPICQSRLGDWVHCDAPGAMPLGWKVPDDVYTARVLSRTPPAQRRDFIDLGAVLLSLFALIALLPEFDGSQGKDWQDRDG